MNTLMNELKERFNYKFTENFGIALESTGSKVYDMFAFGGAYRSRSEEDCILLFKEAFEEDPTLAMKCLFYLRDCRGGQGERRFFRVCLKWLAKNYPGTIIRNIAQIPDKGRWDDVFVLFNTPVNNLALNFIKRQLSLDMNDAMGNKAISLLAKWLPSENAHSQKSKVMARHIRNYLGMDARQYRKMLSKLRAHLKVLETLMSANRWDEIEFDKIPSKAGLVYRNAFARRDIIAKKYESFVMDKKTKVNADTLYPYEVVEKVTEKLGWNFINFKGTELERETLNKYWANLKDYLNGANTSMMCVIDTSGSMTGKYGTSVAPIDVAISLGLYCAERMTGPFANHYISFSRRARLVETRGVDFVDKVARIVGTNLCENTNLASVFDLLLDCVINGKAKVKDLPKTLVVISDMEIDYMSTWYSKDKVQTEMDKIRDKWASHGLELPKLVYWNVSARQNTILDNGPNISYVSGCSPVIFESVLTGKCGVELMLEVLLKDRYKYIMA